MNFFGYWTLNKYYYYYYYYFVRGVLSGRVLSWGVLSGGRFVRRGFVRGVCPGGFCPGGFVREGFVRGVLSGGFCPGGFCPGGFCPRGDFVHRGVLSRGFCPGGFCPRIQKSEREADYSDSESLKHACIFSKGALDYTCKHAVDNKVKNNNLGWDFVQIPQKIKNHITVY